MALRPGIVLAVMISSPGGPHTWAGKASGLGCPSRLLTWWDNRSSAVCPTFLGKLELPILLCQAEADPQLPFPTHLHHFITLYCAAISCFFPVSGRLFCALPLYSLCLISLLYFFDRPCGFALEVVTPTSRPSKASVSLALLLPGPLGLSCIF